jgi:hypothetical protein
MEFGIWIATMKIFEVNNEIELGNAIWSSQSGDKIVLETGEYGNIPLKQGVTYEFEDDATAADILGLGIGVDGGQWSASSVQIGNISITNPRIKKTNIKLYYIFQKKLPFNSRFEPNTSFVHANGVIINIIGNDVNAFSLGGIGEGETKLPKGVVNIAVPCLYEFDINKSDASYISSIFSKNLTEEERKCELESHQRENEKRNHVENTEINRSIGLNLNDFEYKALWAVNSFIREYARITREGKVKGYSTSEFLDGSLITIVKSLDERAVFSSRQFIAQFIGSNIPEEQVGNLYSAYLSSREYSISEFSSYHLEHLNYPMATIGLYQEFEAMWEEYSPAKQDKWGFIEAHTSDPGIKQHLAELINARNNIVHSKVLITSHSNINKLKTEWGARALNEYEIFAYKAPLHWRKSLGEFKAAYNNQIRPTAWSGD